MSDNDGQKSPQIIEEKGSGSGQKDVKYFECIFQRLFELAKNQTDLY